MIITIRRTINSLFDIKDIQKLEDSVQSLKQRVLSAFFLALLISFPLIIFYTVPNLSASLFIVSVSLCIVLLLGYTNKSPSKQFDITITVLCSIYPFCLIYLDPKLISVVFPITSILPLVVLMSTMRASMFIISSVVQTYFLLKYVSSSIFFNLERESLEEACSLLIRNQVLSIIFQSIMGLILRKSLLQIFQKLNESVKSESLREKQRMFLLNFSHEFRNPLNSMLGNIQLALLERPSQAIQSKLQTALNCGEVFLSQLNNILDKGKIDSDDLDFNPVQVNTISWLDKIWGVSSELIKERGLSGHISIDKNIPKFLKLDESRLTQIILNLVGNAVKYTLQGTVNIKLQWITCLNTRKDDWFSPCPYSDSGVFEKDQAMMKLTKEYQTIELLKKQGSLCRARDYPITGVLKIIVTDTGRGISAPQLLRLFEKPDICESTSKLSLGLYITKHLCTKMNGDIRAFSKQGEGSNFIVCIPTEEVIVESTASRLATENDLRNQDIKFLIVDDVDINIVLLTSYLKKLGVTNYETASNGQQAIEKYEDAAKSGKPFNVVCMDIEMPVLDGKSAVQAIRAFEKEKGLKKSLVIFASGNCGEYEIKDCLNPDGLIQADRFLKKPVLLDHFKECLLSSLYVKN